MRLIDADRLIDDMSASALPIMVKGISEITGDESCIVDHINNAPTIAIIDAVPVMHAHFIGWEYDGYADGFPVFDTWVCSECGEEFRSEGDPPAFNFCPNCGARMDGDPHESGQ